MSDQGLVAVISGDLVKSRRLEAERSKVIEGVNSIVDKARLRLAQKECRLFFSGFYRGDAFQCGLSDPRRALWTVVYLRAELMRLRRQDIYAEARFGLGLGAASEWNEKDISASDGEAFRLSGRALDSLKASKEKYRRMRIASPWVDQNPYLTVFAACLDATIQRWTLEQTEAISLFLDDKTQEEISRELHIRQPAVQTRLQRAGHFAVKETLELFSKIMTGSIIRLGPYNQGL